MRQIWFVPLYPLFCVVLFGFTLFGFTSSCSPSLEVDPSAQVSCAKDGDCPGDWKCVEGICGAELGNRAPRIDVESTGRRLRGARFRLDVIDPNPRDQIMVTAQYSTDGVAWCDATGLLWGGPLATSTRGVSYGLAWDGVAESQTGDVCALTLATRPRDDGDTESVDETILDYTDVLKFRFVAQDSAGLRSSTVEITVEAGNVPPVVELDVDSGPVGGALPVAYRLTDGAGDLAWLAVEFRRQGDIDWTAAAIKHGTTEALVTDGAFQVLLWDTENPIGGIGLTNAEVELRVRVWDEVELDTLDFGASVTTPIVLRNNSAPEVSRVKALGGLAGRATGALTLEYRLADEQSDPVDLRIELDAGTGWQPCTEFPSMLSAGRYGLRTSPGNGTLHRFVWDTLADLGPQLPAEVELRVTAADTPAGVGAPAFAAVAGEVGVTAEPTPGSYSLVRSNAWAEFGAATVLADFNGDGLDDLAYESRTGNVDFAVRLRNADGTFGSAVTYSGSGGTDPGWGDLIEVDLNGDPYLDLIYYTFSDSYSFINDGTFSGTFTNRGRIGGGNVERDLVADFNGDGHNDLFRIDSSNSQILLGDGDGTFTIDPNGYGLSDAVSAVTGDFDGDGNADIAVAVSEVNTLARVSVALGTGATALAEVKLGTPTVLGERFSYEYDDNGDVLLQALHLGAVDLNGDGADELLVFSNEYQQYSVMTVYLGGDTLTPLGSSLPVPGKPARLLVDADNQVWSIGANYGSQVGGWTTRFVNRWTLEATGMVAVERLALPGCQVTMLPWERVDLVVADLDGDGHKDLLVGQDCSTGALDEWWATRAGTFIGETFSEIATAPAVGQPGALVATDLDSDGVVDVGWIAHNPETAMLLRGRGSFAQPAGGFEPVAGASFEVEVDWSNGWARKQHFADVTGDGRLDAIYSTVNVMECDVFVLPIGTGNDGLSFAPVQNVCSGSIGNGFEPSVEFVDIDADGYADFLGNAGEGLVAYAETDMAGWTGAFETPSSLAPNHIILDAEVADLNADGVLDLLMVGYGSTNALLVRLGTGFGFGSICQSTLPTQPRRLVVGDFDADGAIDAVVALSDGNLTTLEGLGGCPISNNRGTVTLGATAEDLRAADLNRDGRLDLVAVLPSGIVVVPGDPMAVSGAMAFQPMVSSGMMADFARVRLADVDRDGVLDMVASSDDTHSVEVGRGQRTSSRNVWSVDVTDLNAPMTVMGRDSDRFGEPIRVTLGRRIYTTDEARALEHDLLTQMRQSGPAAARNPALRLVTYPWEVGGDVLLAEDIDDERWRVVPRLGVDPSGRWVGLDLGASPPRGVVFELPLVPGMEEVDFGNASLVTFLRTRDWLRAEEDGEALPRVADPRYTSGFRPEVVEEYQWVELSQYALEDLAAGTGARFAVDASGDHPVVRVIADRLGVFVTMIEIP